MDQAIIVTKTFLDRAASDKGCHSKAQLLLLGVDWPPRKGWKKNLQGTRLSALIADRIVRLRGKKPHEVRSGQLDLFD